MRAFGFVFTFFLLLFGTQTAHAIELGVPSDRYTSSIFQLEVESFSDKFEPVKSGSTSKYAQSDHSGDTGGMIFGLGIQMTSLGTSHPVIGSDSGSGYYLSFGEYMTRRVEIEAIVTGFDGIDLGTNPDPYYPPDKGNYSLMSLGIKYNFEDREKGAIVPWAFFGLSFHSVSWDTYFYGESGTGMTVGGGADMYMLDNHAIRVGAHLSNFKLGGKSSNATMLSIGYRLITGLRGF